MDFLNILDSVNEIFETKLILNEVSFFQSDKRLEISLISKLRVKNKEAVSGSIREKLSYLELDVDVVFIELGFFVSKFIDASDFDIEIDMDTFTESGFSLLNFLIPNINYAALLEKNSEYKKLSKYAKNLNVEIKFSEVENKLYQEEVEEIFKKNESSLKDEISKVSENVYMGEKKRFAYGTFNDVSKKFSEINDLIPNQIKILVKGRVFFKTFVKLRTKAYIIKFDIVDKKNAVRCKLYVKEEEFEKIDSALNPGMYVNVSGVFKYDEFDAENVLSVFSILETEDEYVRLDESDVKRIEFNIHSKYTTTESVVDIEDIVNVAKKWGHKAIGLTDLYNVQAYPKLYNLAKKKGIKLNLGLDAKLLQSDMSIITNYFDKEIRGKDIVVFDIETTGLSRYNDRITEIGAVRIRDGKVLEEFQRLVNPERLISEFITNLTGITDEMVVNEKKINEVLPEFIEFCGDSLLAAHNAEFDMGFILENARRLGYKFENAFLDTMYLARALNPNLKNHKLDTLTKHYNVVLKNHHRASDDARATGFVLINMLNDLDKLGFDLYDDINNMPSDFPIAKHNFENAIIFVQNKEGLKNLYTLVSLSSIDYLNRVPGIPFFELEKYRKGLLVGSGNYNSKLFDMIALGYPDYLLEKQAEKFDFLRLTPKDFAPYLIEENYIRDLDHLIDINIKLILLAEKLGKIAIATGDVYYIEKYEHAFRNILLNYPRKRFRESTGCFDLKTSQEMLDNFDYLDVAVAEDVVIYNTHKLNDMIENISPIADGTFPPVLENAENKLREESFKKARDIYGEDLPEIVKSRLERELNSIISNGYATLYIIAQKLVRKSNEDGYLVGSRGSVGSSFAATMADITEVNPLPAHYVCPNCKNSEFILDGSYGCGVDLPDKKCPKCGCDYKKDGFDIPFEVFLGFEGDKEPDIDLNFASVYQARIHKYTETIFGKKKVFRAGTLGTIADKTAYGMARKYKEFYPDDDEIRLDSANINYIMTKITGVKRTSGQHPGGLIIVPDNKDIEDFTPVQYPADDPASGNITTHFEYHDIDKNLLKLDLLGHTSPTIVRMLTDQSGIDAINVDLSDKKTMSIFNSTEALNIKHPYTNSNSGALGIPEFGTGFVREMLKDTKPSTFIELVRISGLSHGTDVWLNNAQTLINNGICSLKDAICTRDDIMNYLISMQLENKHSFEIMERVRKGKGLSGDDEKAMKDNSVPQWYIDSCNKIKYMFPKAHAVAYVMMSYRIAYYKVHHPEYFYSTYFTNKIGDFQYGPVINGLEYLTKYIKEYLADESNSTNDDKYYCLELAEEMLARDIELLPVDLYKSSADEFLVPEKGKLLPPLMALDSISQSMAQSIVLARQDGEFISIEDFKMRTKINKNAVSSLEAAGLFEGMQGTNQMDFFSF